MQIKTHKVSIAAIHLESIDNIIQYIMIQILYEKKRH